MDLSFLTQFWDPDFLTMSSQLKQQNPRLFEQTNEPAVDFSAMLALMSGLAPGCCVQNPAEVAKNDPLESQSAASVEAVSLCESSSQVVSVSSVEEFAVDANGQRLWASSLRMLVDEQGYLVTPEGYRVLGKNGPIKWNENYNVDQQGNILLNDQIVDSFLISDVNVQEVVNDRYFVGEQLQSNFRVFQTYLETSNVDEIGQVTALMTILRHYQSNVKVVQAEDAALAKIINIMV